MKSLRRTLMLAGALCASLAAGAALAADNKVVIGDIDDMSGPYADVIGAAGVESIKMAIADFGGSVLGQPIEILTFDHQNKPDLAGQKLREWADTDGLTMLLGGSNTGVSLAMSAAAKEKKVPFFAIGAAGASLTGKDCTPYTIHYGYDTTALSNGTAKTILEEGGKSWFFITADYAFGKQLEAAASDSSRRAAEPWSATFGCRSARRTFPPISSRRRAPARRCSRSPTPARTRRTRSRRRRNSASPRR